MGCSSGFSRRSVGYVGFSDGWQDLMHNFKMDWEFEAAENGNIALTAEIDLPNSGEFTVAVALGRSYQSAPRSCSNRWPSHLSQSAGRMFVNGNAQSWIPNSILAATRLMQAECIG